MSCLGAGVLALFAWGCPDLGNASSAIDDFPQIDVDKDLIGDWHCMNVKEDEATIFRFEELSEREYRIVEPSQATDAESAGEDGQSTKGTRAFESTIGEDRFLNLEESGAGEKKTWMFFRMSFPRSNILYLEGVLPRSFKEPTTTATSAGTRAAIETALSLKEEGAIFSEMACVRREAKKDDAKKEKKS